METHYDLTQPDTPNLRFLVRWLRGLPPIAHKSLTNVKTEFDWQEDLYTQTFLDRRLAELAIDWPVRVAQKLQPEYELALGLGVITVERKPRGLQPR